MSKYNPRPTTCNLCGGAVEYVKMKDIGITPYQSGWCYHCASCGAFVGTHRKAPKEALGILAKGNVRSLRVEAHNEFDRHWVSLAGKNRAYFRLSKELGIKSEECHFGHMDECMLNQSIEIMKTWGNLSFN